MTGGMGMEFLWPYESHVLNAICYASGVYIVYWVWSVYVHAYDRYVVLSQVNDAVMAPGRWGRRWKGKKVWVVVNPASGGGMGADLYDGIVTPVLAMAGVDALVSISSAPGEVLGLIKEDNVDVSSLAAVLVCGGDGTFHEVLNALHQEDQAILSSLPLMVLPMGTSNGLARSNGDSDILPALLRLLDQDPQELDVWDVEVIPFAPDSPPVTRVDAFMLSWALVALHDEYQERKFRWMGPSAASLLAPLVAITSLPTFDGIITFLPCPEANAQAQEAGWDYYGDPEALSSLPAPAWFAERHPERAHLPWRAVPTPIILCSAVNSPWIASDVTMSPGADMADGALDLCLLGPGSSRWNALNIFRAMETGSQVDYPHTSFYKASALHIVPAADSAMSVSGEKVECGEVRVVVRGGGGWMIR